MKILNVITVYPEAIRATVSAIRHLDYTSTLNGVRGLGFGADFHWSEALRRIGHDVRDVVANSPDLQAKWRAEELANKDASPEDTVIEQAKASNADAVVLQDASFLSRASLAWLRERGVLIVAQISCPMPSPGPLPMVHLAFTSFPHYVGRLKELGVGRVEFLPLAFEPAAFDSLPKPQRRDIDIAFVGGVGKDLHWRAGTEALEALARAMPNRFQWWGYGLDRLALDSPLRACHKGEAWGRDELAIYLRSKIVVNRHGEVAEGSGNNLRQYAATGCGACLVTDQAGVFEPGRDCAVYSSPSQLPAVVEDLLGRDAARASIAALGQAKTFAEHTYARRAPVIARAIEEELAKLEAAKPKRR